MELLFRFGSEEQVREWLLPLLQGRIRSAFLMTEPEVASSDARNVGCRVQVDASGAISVTGRKWWATGACNPECRVFFVCACLDRLLAWEFIVVFVARSGGGG
jgi:acyl-CoA dehydrogenase